jgi:hypothetical protein
MKKWDVTLSCKVITTYTIEAESAEDAERIADEVFAVYVDYEEADNAPEVVTRCTDSEYRTEEVREWTAS